jgi:hypothetical protein
MSFPLIQERSVHPLVLLAAMLAGFVSGAPHRAHAANSGSSPFAGCYIDYANPDGLPRPYFITIDDAGRISATIPFGGQLSGSISDSGSMRVTVVEKFIGDHGGVHRIRYRYSGFGALDEFGNLYGVLQNQYGGVWEFFWQRCD